MSEVAQAAVPGAAEPLEATRRPGSRTLAHAAWLLAAALLLLAVFEATDADMALQKWLFELGGGRFPWRSVEWVDTWLYARLKSALYLLPIVSALQWLRWRKRKPELARRWLYVAVAMSAAPLLVAGLKQLTNRPCPWDVVEFGGSVAHRSLLELAAPAGRSFACFPGGHSSGGYALMAFAFAGGLPGARSRLLGPTAFAIAALALGTLMGATRMLQGAHFLSHILWSAWFVWLVQWAIARAMLPGRAGTAG